MPVAIEQEKKSFAKPDDRRSFDKGQIEVVNIGEATIGRTVLQPGWKWSTSVKPIVKTDSCQVSHLLLIISGRLHFKMDDGVEFDVNAGDVATITPGHDAWVVGDAPLVAFDISGAENYAKNE